MKEKLISLFQKFLKGNALEDEKVELAELVAKESDDTLTNLLKTAWEQHSTSTGILSDEEASGILQNILKPGFKKAPIYKMPFYKRTSFRVAASVILLVAVFFLIKTNTQKNIASPENPIAAVQIQDILPGGNKAILQLADGSTIILDSSNNGNIANQGETKIIKIDGQLAYNADGSSKEVLYNTISTPRGGQYQLILADGSKVWLNAASSLHFPTSFTGKERKVTLTGEGYFEVAKNAEMPFKVDVAGKGTVEVLGTHFNINAYENEPAINTTLLEGAVKFSTNSPAKKEEVHLIPGQQAQFKYDGQITVIKKADLESVMAWKNGNLIFQGEGLQYVMRQLERWYNIDVEYKGKISSEEFVGNISRNVNISKILKMLEATGSVKFEIVGRKVIVK